MYTIPKEFDLKQFLNSTVRQICFTINTISIYFSNNGCIGTEGKVNIVHKGRSFEFDTIPVNSDNNLLNLLEKRVINLSTNLQRTLLMFIFEDEYELHFLSDEYYESFNILINDKNIIV